MSRIRLRQYYTELVEHYFRMAVRYNNVTRDTPQNWYDFTVFWIEGLSDNDKKFIQFVFGKQFFATDEGLYCFQSDEIMYTKRTRLALLEKEFAIASGLIMEDTENDGGTESKKE